MIDRDKDIYGDSLQWDSPNPSMDGGTVEFTIVYYALNDGNQIEKKTQFSANYQKQSFELIDFLGRLAAAFEGRSGMEAHVDAGNKSIDFPCDIVRLCGGANGSKKPIKDSDVELGDSFVVRRVQRAGCATEEIGMSNGVIYGKSAQWDGSADNNGYVEFQLDYQAVSPGAQAQATTVSGPLRVYVLAGDDAVRLAHLIEIAWNTENPTVQCTRTGRKLTFDVTQVDKMEARAMTEPNWQILDRRMTQNEQLTKVGNGFSAENLD